MRTSWGTRLRASVFGTPLYIAAVGLVLTTLVAVLQQSNQQRERELLFQSEVNAIEVGVSDAIRHQAIGFESSISFNAATHPASLLEYRTFFRREFTVLDELDPGVILVEAVHVDDIDALEAREKSLNRDTFSVLAPLPSRQDERLIITRTGHDIDLFGVPMLGLDVTPISSLILPVEIPESGFALRIIEPEPLLDVMTANSIEASLFRPGVQPTVVALVGSIERPNGEFIGYAVRFMDVSGLLAPLIEAVPAELNVQLFVDGIDEPVAQFGAAAEDVTDPQFSAARGTTTSTLDWQVHVRATDQFGAALGLVEQANVWILGLPLSLIAALMVIVSEYHRRQLDEAAFEVEHALALASTDPLTGLLNRQGLIDSARSLDDQETAALFFVDLDGFKVVNDLDGHDEGDRVLREVARRLRDICRPEDFVCRMGGDEFVLFTPRAGTDAHMEEVSNRITTALSAIDDRVTASVGVAARRPGQRTDVKELLRRADQAMYDAKRAGGDRYSVGRDIEGHEIVGQETVGQ